MVGSVGAVGGGFIGVPSGFMGVVGVVVVSAGGAMVVVSAGAMVEVSAAAASV